MTSYYAITSVNIGFGLGFSNPHSLSWLSILDVLDILVVSCPNFLLYLDDLVSLALLKILCLFSFVNIQPRITSIGSKNAFPKADRAILFLSTRFPSNVVVLRLITLLPID